MGNEFPGEHGIALVRLLRRHFDPYIEGCARRGRRYNRIWIGRINDIEKRVLQGADPDSLILPLGNCKPHKYY